MMRISIWTGTRPPIKAEVAQNEAAAFIIHHHAAMPGAVFMVNDELIDPELLIAAIQSRQAQATATAPAGAPAAPATPAEPSPAPAPASINLEDCKSFTELVQSGLAALTKLHLDAAASISRRADEMFGEQLKQSREFYQEMLKHNQEFGKVLTAQREDQRKALKDIGSYDRGTAVARAAEEMAFRSGAQKKPESSGYTGDDVVHGLAKMHKPN